MGLLRFLGLGRAGGGTREPDGDTVRRIARELERLPSEQAQYLAAFAYVLARVAHADLDIDARETAAMEEAVGEIAQLSDAESALVVRIAQNQARNLGGTQDYVITRQFRQISSREQRGQLLACLYAVAAADGTISGEESAEIAKIGEELGFTRAESNSLRARYREQLGVLRR